MYVACRLNFFVYAFLTFQPVYASLLQLFSITRIFIQVNFRPPVEDMQSVIPAES